MKTWENAAIEEMNFDQTQYGGTPSMDIDNNWLDQNGARHINFEPVPES